MILNSSSEDITSAIEDSITDAEIPDTLEPEQEPTEALEATPEPVEATTPEPPAPTLETKPEPPKADDFDKKFGLSPQSASGRENRIPYSRVKKISEKAVKDAQEAWSKERDSGYIPTTKYTELEARAKDYEARLSQVAEFERIMTTDHNRFLTMLAGVPGYREIFELWGPQTQAQPATPQVQTPISDDMPQPDQTLSDGSTVYSMEGLKSLLSWQAKQVEDRVTKQISDQVEKRYGPLEKDYNNYQRTQAVIPHVQKQIAEARTWKLFNENEDEIVKTLQTNPTMNLERAYQVVVFPKLEANRDTMRAELLKEIKQAPRATAAPSGATKSAPAQTPSGPRSLEDVIADSIKVLK